MAHALPSSRAAGAALWLAFFAAILAAWVFLWRNAEMAGLDLLGRPAGPHMMPMTAFAPLFGMWAVMMAAMMLPTLVPTLATYGALIRIGAGSRPGWIGLVLGFLGIWVAFAAAIAGVQSALAAAGAIGDLGGVGAGWAAGALLIGAGLWQFTNAKAVCHGVCVSPTAWFLGRWRPGFTGGVAMGSGLGAFCVGCCWTYMALGFAGGTMNLAWMGIATLLMVLEKLPEIGRRVFRPVGGAMVAAGIAWAML